MLTPGLVIALALGADWVLGEIRRGHPLVGFGALAARLERIWNRRERRPRARRIRGVIAVLVLVAPPAAAGGWLAASAPLGDVLALVLLYLTLGLRSLCTHAGRVARALASGETEAARAAVGAMVSRDVSRLSPRRMAAAAIESTLENGADAVFASLFWFLVAGVPGVVVHRLVNTLDAMWGDRTARLAEFGWFVARLDDVLNWIPARLTAMTYALVSGHPRRALACARRQGRLTGSPNAGVVMAAGAGALVVRVGGSGVYHGQFRWRPRFGVGAPPSAAAIDRSVRLLQRGALVWTAAVLLVELALA